MAHVSALVDTPHPQEGFRVPLAAVAMASIVGLLLWTSATEVESPEPHVALWVTPATAVPAVGSSLGVTAVGPQVAAQPLLAPAERPVPQLRMSVPAGRQALPIDMAAEVPAGPQWALGLGSFLAAAYSLTALQQWRRGRHSEPSLAMVSVSGERFDPLRLERPPAARAEVQHGRVSLGAVLASGCVVASLCALHPALAEGVDFGFNYDFDVDFEGWKIDHRILVDVIVTGQFVGFVGALIGGYSARQRKKEVEQLATKLKQVNRQLRQQARRQKEGLYTPLDLQRPALPVTDEASGQNYVVLEMLKKGKKCLRDNEPQRAVVLFEEALRAIDATPDFKDPLLAKRKAYRGIGGAYVQIGGRPQAALDALMKVLDLTRQIGDNTGLCDAYGVIADIYTDMNKLDKAAEYYDLYIANLEQDQSAETM